MTKKRQKKLAVGFVALGCPKNIVDSEKMLAQIAQADMLITADSKTADIVIINTCGFIAPAKAEAIEAIEQAVGLKAKGKVKKVIVAGCLAQRLGEELFNQVNGIDAIIGLGERDNIADVIRRTYFSDKAAAYLQQCCTDISDDRTRLLITPSHSAYLRISEGCDHRCSFCTIPAIRGRFRSKPKNIILQEAQELADAGVTELNIIAQDTAYYGKDLKIKDGLAELLGEIEKISGIKWLRLMYLYPFGFTDKLIETIAESKKIVNYLDIPIQHISNDILKKMRRPDTKEQICELIEKLRAVLPDVIFRTTLIVGFPGETDQQFDELVEFIEWAQFDCLGCFKYYPEEGTESAKWPEQVPEEIKDKRVEQLMLVQQEIAFDKNQSRIGSKLTCLIDSVDDEKTAMARFYGQAPEIDSVCIIKNCSAAPGQFVDTKVIDTKDYDLIVEQI